MGSIINSLVILVTTICVLAPVLETKFSPVKCNNIRHRRGNLTVSSLGRKPSVPPIDEICAIIGTEIYECVNGVCCTPGDPESQCCPFYAPICVQEGCCEAGHPQVCMDEWCCEATDVCCPEGCCKAAHVCCGAGCCDKDQTCCNNTCCDKGQKCCGDHGDQCCNATDNLICEKEAFNTQCPYQFDALSCDPGLDYQHFIDVLQALSRTCPDVKALDRLYRVLRKDESCANGMLSKDPAAKQSVRSYLNCATLPSYKSQFMSFTSSPEVAMAYLKVSGLKRIGVVDVKPVNFSGCEILPLANLVEASVVKSAHPVRQKVASVSCEFLLMCKEPLPCYDITF